MFATSAAMIFSMVVSPATTSKFPSKRISLDVTTIINEGTRSERHATQDAGSQRALDAASVCLAQQHFQLVPVHELLWRVLLLEIKALRPPRNNKAHAKLRRFSADRIAFFSAM
jgi:hypothetical protein